MMVLTCQFCSGALRMQPGKMGGQCTRCGRYYSSDELYRLSSFRQPEADREADPAKIVAFVIGAVLCLCLFPAMPMMLLVLAPVLIVLAAKQLIHEAETESEQAKQPVAAGDKLRNVDDFIRAFRMLPLQTMPLRAEAGRAISQLDMLKRKQVAIAALLPQNHPFIQSANDAARYIMNNLRQVYYRLQFCDQNDRELRRVHAAFLNERMDDNERVLRDFENLIIEVTQMDDGLPMNAPTLDVLASTLRSVRTGDCLPADGGVLYMKGEMK